MKKKLSIIAAAVLALALCLTGCAPKLDGKETVYTTSGYRYTSFDTTPENLVVVPEEETTE